MVLLRELDIVQELRNAERIGKRRLYERLGLELSFDPSKRVVHAHAGGWAESCVGGPHPTEIQCAHLLGRFQLAAWTPSHLTAVP